MSQPSTIGWIRPTRLTVAAATATVVVIACSSAILAFRYAGLPEVLPVRFMSTGVPNGWQYKTILRVLLPVFVQVALALTLGSIGALLLSRSHGTHVTEELAA